VQQALATTCAGIGTVTNVHCEDFASNGEPTEAVCGYTVNKGSQPTKDKTYFAVDSKGWHTIDTPAYCPGKK